MRYIEWSDPWPGLDAQGNEVTCNHTSTVTEEDAIRIQRYNYSKLRPGKPFPPHDQLLDDFVIVNWATIREVLS